MGRGEEARESAREAARRTAASRRSSAYSQRLRPERGPRSVFFCQVWGRRADDIDYADFPISGLLRDLRKLNPSCMHRAVLGVF